MGAWLSPNETAGKNRGLLRPDHQAAGGGRVEATQHPNHTLRIPGHLYVGDWGQRSHYGLDPGRQVDPVLPTASAVRGALPRARDAKGNFYLDQCAAGRP